MLINRSNNACKFFPCHNGLEDCTFCYCPFYPCLDKDLGKDVYSKKLKKDIWSCQNCGWIHKRDIVNDIFALIRKKGSELKKEGQKFKARDTGVIILCHGSRVKTANSALLNIVELVKKRVGMEAIEPAYLQLSQPELKQSIKKLVHKGYKRIIIVPFFLFNGNHVSRDIPEAISKEIAQYPKVKFIYTRNLGQDARIGEIVTDRIKEVVICGSYD